jgi:uracil-DNA glycosylase family 4
MTLPTLPPSSPSGQPTCPSSGPLDARIVLVAESPASEEIRQQQPLVGRSGQLLSSCLGPAGLKRSSLRIVNVVPCQAPRNEFSRHSSEDLQWGLDRLKLELEALAKPELLVLLGGNPMRYVAGLDDRITLWRGSLLPPPGDCLEADLVTDYWCRLSRAHAIEWQGRDKAWTLPTFHPAAVLRQMEWHIWLLNDLKRAGRFVDGRDYPRPKRRWYLNQPSETKRLLTELARDGGIVAVDTEMTEPPITALVTADEVHSFYWSDDLREPLAEVMQSPQVMKVAHNMAHDWRQMEKVYGVPVRPPWADTIAYAHAFEPGGQDPSDRAKAAGKQLVGKALSPHISSRYTGWPYHKWLVDQDKLVYCGMDTVVCYDAYVTQVQELEQRPELKPVLEQDHRLFRTLFRASSAGVLIDREARQQVEEELRADVEQRHNELEAEAWPYIEQALARGGLRKPKLFRVQKQCQCCGGGSAKRARCWACAGYERSPTKAMLLQDFPQLAEAGLSKKELLDLTLGECQQCSGEGSRELDKGLNLDSSDQVADLFYRALRIPARRYQGRETVRFEQLERLLEPGGYLGPEQSSRVEARQMVERYVELSKARADLATVARLTPGPDGRLRTTFDLWYTPTHRVASRESLLDIGTNLQNIPKPARRFVVPREGSVFLYPDYAQIEGRAQAVLTRDQRLLEIYNTPGGDSHQMVADLVVERCGVEISRPQAKRLSFAAFYDIEAPHLADILGVTLSQAHQILRAFFQTFPATERYKQRVEQELRLSRSCTSPTGWKRRWLGYVLETGGRRKGRVKEKVRKEALASGPQNMAAWVMAEGLLAIDEAAGWTWAEQQQQQEPWIRPLVHVHDSVLLEVDADRAPAAIRLVEEKMAVECFGMHFPASCLVGPDWLTASLDDDEKADEWKRSAWLQRG